MVTANAAHTNTINHARNVDLIENFPAFYRISSQLARPKIKSFFTFLSVMFAGLFMRMRRPVSRIIARLLFGTQKAPMRFKTLAGKLHEPSCADVHCGFQKLEFWSRLR